MRGATDARVVVTNRDLRPSAQLLVIEMEVALDEVPEVVFDRSLILRRRWHDDGIGDLPVLVDAIAVVQQAPRRFGDAVAFAGATDPAEAVPTLTAPDGVLTGDLSAYTAYYGEGSFNQGAPKPDGSGEAPMGTIDPETGAYVLDWTSQIVGGSFNDFVGVWHLEGTFTPGS